MSSMTISALPGSLPQSSGLRCISTSLGQAHLQCAQLAKLPPVPAPFPSLEEGQEPGASPVQVQPHCADRLRQELKPLPRCRAWARCSSAGASATPTCVGPCHYSTQVQVQVPTLKTPPLATEAWARPSGATASTSRRCCPPHKCARGRSVSSCPVSSSVHTSPCLRRVGANTQVSFCFMALQIWQPGLASRIRLRLSGTVRCDHPGGAAHQAQPCDPSSLQGHVAACGGHHTGGLDGAGVKLFPCAEMLAGMLLLPGVGIMQVSFISHAHRPAAASFRKPKGHRQVLEGPQSACSPT